MTLHTSPFSPGSEVLTLPQSGPVSEASDRLNRINMPCVSCETGSVDGPPDGQTSAIYRQVTLSGELASTARPSSAGDSPASRSVLPGSEEAKRMTVTSGRKCLESCGSSGPLGLLERMLLESSAWNSTLVVLTWKVKGIPSGRSLFQLAASVPGTDGSGVLLLPTPTAPGKHQVGRITEWGGSKNPYRILPTPTARDYRAPGLPEKREARMRVRAQPLPEVIGGMLNPQWVEWLMGFPIGWTDYDVSAMQSSRNKSIRSLRGLHRLRRRRS
jgi:hypothetical protein